jgi:hypothetical protein
MENNNVKRAVEAVGTLKVNTEIGRIKLERLGRRIIEARIYGRRARAFDRKLLEVVRNYSHASAHELKDALDAVYAERNASVGPTEDEIQAEVDKLR